MKTRLLLLGCLLALSVQAQETKRELWTWKDANGVTQYSDRPVPGAKKVEMHTSAPATPAPAPAPKPAEPRPSAAPAETRYESFEFISPLQDESFFGSSLEITVRLRSEPDLAPGDQLRMYMDGKQVDEAKDRYEHTFTNIERGAHKVTAIIFDRMGKPKINAEPRTFYIKQATIIDPKAVGPLLKPPPPKPTPKPTPKN